MLHIGIDHRDEEVLRMPSTTADDSPLRPILRMKRNPRIGTCDFRHCFGGAVGRVIIDDHDLPVYAVEGVSQPFDEGIYLVDLLEGRNYEGETRDFPPRSLEVRKCDLEHS
ncbi:hypothetical protein ATY81_27770 [Rhizobium sp. R72]|nr:hypothetical protein ATY81_27770 [Rhizobium sp. R72]OWV96645.1 hypothetical protein ATY80_27770 [Rhizobium sp. R711]